MQPDEFDKVLLKKHEPCAKKYWEEAHSIRIEFLDNMRTDYENMRKREEEILKEEAEIINDIKLFTEEPDFLVILQCREYKDKIESILCNGELISGDAKEQLMKIHRSLCDIKIAYESEYERFCEDAQAKIDKSLNDIELELKSELEEFCKKKVMSRELFSELKNAKLL